MPNLGPRLKYAMAGARHILLPQIVAESRAKCSARAAVRGVTEHLSSYVSKNCLKASNLVLRSEHSTKSALIVASEELKATLDEASNVD
ncbi:hypothetical protein NDU88_005752 [Pleurodeles waltl]|uniref:Uncharacterized protein n=1 Tax=Pleurodeles waltl TaxID=8319 RepID=A0AAV7UKE4_PLEWA|nr:hypothetical protein NDU88_005752 [Pleurodeles waltl]